MVTLEETKRFIRLDHNDDDDDILDMIEVAQIYIDSNVGEQYKSNTKLVRIADLLVKKLVFDMYENRSYTVSSNAKKDLIINSMLDKLALENWSD